jgi:hypothetical protein
MTRPFSMLDLARVVLPFGSQNGAMVMLSAYFDDSGTHPTSEIVVLAGAIGTHYQWQYLSDLWAEKLAKPSPGKPPLERFHMAPCQAADGEFAGWSRTATDYLVHELTNIILRCGVWCYGCAVPRKDWDELVTGRLRVAMGDSEGTCARACYVAVQKVAAEHVWDNEVAFIFDNRPHRFEENKKIFEVFQSEIFRKSSLSFESNQKVLPLQAADLIAWQVYQYSHSLKTGINEKTESTFDRERKRLFDSERAWVQYRSRQDIEKMVNNPNTDAVLASLHFSGEDPTKMTDAELLSVFNELGMGLGLTARPSVRRDDSA